MMVKFIIFIFLLVCCGNIFFLAVYCRTARKRDCIKRSIKPNCDSQNIPISGNAVMGTVKKILQSMERYFYGWTRYSSLLVGRFPSNRIRNWVFRYIFCMEATRKTVINGGCELRSPWNIKADNCIIGNNNILDGRSGIEIGNNVVFGADVRVWTMEHDVNDPWFRVTEGHALPVKIDSHAWICSGSTILPGVQIGQGAVVASKACVIKDCDMFGIYGGVPAKKIGTRTQDLRYTLSGKPTWHFY